MIKLGHVAVANEFSVLNISWSFKKWIWILFLKNIGIIFVLPTCSPVIPTEGCSRHHANLAWTNNLLCYGLAVTQAIVFYKKSHSINQKYHSSYKIVMSVNFKIKRFLSMSFWHTHCLGYRNLEEISLFPKTYLFCRIYL